jgi:hypothetical protein
VSILIHIINKLKMQKINLKSIINTGRTNNKTKNISTNNNYDIKSNLNINLYNKTRQLNKNLELKSKNEKNYATQFNNSVRNTEEAVRDKSKKHKKNISEIPTAYSKLERFDSRDRKESLPKNNYEPIVYFLI